MKRVAASVGLAVVIAGSAQAQTGGKQVFACIEQDANGFSHDGTSYRRQGFNPRKFTIVLDGMNLNVKIGNDEEPYICSKPFNSRNVLQCVEKTYFMVFSLDNHRFNRAQILGPVSNTQKPDDMAVSYGTCQRF
ncbi:hypothetical protein KBI52_03755 [Microvirga sp. HBU67558]|uniref:hypothetical protein n=1 Tax=Microvirga TaxID=186650 RepID=UPI001B35B126|nr:MULTISPECIES: hypothetical protein [unclassified Microvirga]MBQ0819346.1 hypothetical protein [Microvirga sp. HBU67558]